MVNKRKYDEAFVIFRVSPEIYLRRPVTACHEWRLDRILKKTAVIEKFQIFLSSTESGLSPNTMPLHESWSLVGSPFTVFQIEI